MFVYLSVFLPLCICLPLSISARMCLSSSVSMCMLVYTHVKLSVFLSVHLHVYLYICLSIRPFVCLFVSSCPLLYPMVSAVGITTDFCFVAGGHADSINTPCLLSSVIQKWTPCPGYSPRLCPPVEGRRAAPTLASPRDRVWEGGGSVD